MKSDVPADWDTTSMSGVDARRQALQWAVANKAANGSLPSGKVIADRYGRPNGGAD